MVTNEVGPPETAACVPCTHVAASHMEEATLRLRPRGRMASGVQNLEAEGAKPGNRKTPGRGRARVSMADKEVTGARSDVIQLPITCSGCYDVRTLACTPVKWGNNVYLTGLLREHDMT